MPLTEEQRLRVEEVRKTQGDAYADVLLEAYETQRRPAIETEGPSLPDDPKHDPKLIPGQAPFAADPGPPWGKTTTPRLLESRAQLVRMEKKRLQEGGLSEEEADAKAREKMRRLFKPREPGYHARPSIAPAKRKPWELEGLSALGEAFKQQRLETPEEQFERKESQRQGRETRRRLMEDFDRESKRLGVPVGDLITAHLARQQAQFHHVAPEYYERATNKSMETATPEDINAMGRQLYHDYVQQVFPERMTEEQRSLKKKAVSMASDVLQSALVKEEEGFLTETLLGTVMRDVAGIWRTALTPLQEVLTYDVDEEGKPVDPEDIAYKIGKWLDEKGAPPVLTAKGLPLVAPRPFQARKLDPERQGLDYFQSVAKDIAQMRFLGDDFTDLPSYQEWWEAAGNPKAPWVVGLGAELVLPIVPPVVRWAQMLMKGGASVARAGRLAKVADIIDKGAHPVLGMRADKAKRLVMSATAGTGEVKLPTGIDAHSVRAAGAEHLGREAAAAHILNATKNPERYVGRLGLAETEVGARVVREGPDFLEGFVKALDDSDNPLTRRASGWARQALRSVREGDIEGSRAAITAARATESQKALRQAERILARTDLRDVERARALEELAKAQPRTPTALGQAVQDITTSKVYLELLDQVPGDMVFATPTTVVSRKAWGQVKGHVEQGARRLLKGTWDDAGEWRAATPQAAKELTRIMGPQAILRSEEFWLPTWQSLRAGTPISQRAYQAVSDAIVGDLVLRAVDDSATLQWHGKAAARAAKPAERRLPGREWGDIGRGIREAFRKAPDLQPGKVGLPAELTVKGRTPIAIANWINRSKERIANLVEELSRDFAATQRGPAGFQQVLDKSVDHLLAPIKKQIDQVLDAMEQPGLSNKAKDRLQAQLEKLEEARRLELDEIWGDMAKIFFGPEAWPVEGSPRIIRQLSGSAEINARNLQAYIKNARAYFHKDLPKKGLAPSHIGKRQDALFETLTSWLVQIRRNQMLKQLGHEVVQETPELAFPGRLIGTPSLVQDALVAAPPNLQVEARNIMNAALREVSEQRAPLNEAILFGSDGNGGLIGRQLLRNRRPATLLDVMDDVEFKALDGVKGPLKDWAYDLKQSLLRPAYEFQLKTMTEHGVLRAGRLGEPVAFEPTHLFRIDGQAVGALLGEQAAKLVEDLEEVLKSGAVGKQLEPLRRIEKGAVHSRLSATYGWAAFVDTWNTLRRATVGGLLGGFVLPITRFHAINFMTAPVIMATTLGPKMAAKASVSAVADLGSMLAARALPGAADEVLFVAEGTGREWTRGALEAAILRNNIRFSQVSFEFGDVMLFEMRRLLRTDSRILKSFKPYGPRQVLRWLDPTNKNLWSTLAEANDNLFRKNVFTTALKEGRTEAEAAHLARNALLDYGAMGQKEKEIIARIMLFYAFRRQMALETARAALNKPGTLRAMMQAQQQQQKDAGVWALAPEDYQVRMWGYLSDKMQDDQAFTAHFGPGNPTMESFQDMLAVFAFIASTPKDWGTLRRGTEEFLFSPELELWKEIRQWGAKERHGGFVAPRYVSTMMEADLWPWFYDAFDIEAVKGEQRRGGEPTFHQAQFRFGSAEGEHAYLGFKYAAQKLALERGFKDWATAAMIAGELGPEGSDLKRYADEKGWGQALQYALTLDTPIKIPDEFGRRAEVIRKIERELTAR